jgi:hypothetical protein
MGTLGGNTENRTETKAHPKADGTILDLIGIRDANLVSREERNKEEEQGTSIGVWQDNGQRRIAKQS